MITLSAAIDIWDQMLSGQVGFILATLLAMIFYWRCIIPRDEKREARMLAASDEQAKAISGLAVAVRMLVVHQLQKEGKNGEEILRTLDNLPK